jgi:hypothetical protein
MTIPVFTIKFNSFTSPRIKLSSNQFTYEALADSGSGLIHVDTFSKIPNIKDKLQPLIDLRLVDVNNRPSETLGTVTLNANLLGRDIEQEFIVTRNISEDCIFCWDATRNHCLLVDGELNSVYFKNEQSKERQQ